MSHRYVVMGECRLSGDNVQGEEGDGDGENVQFGEVGAFSSEAEDGGAGSRIIVKVSL